MIKYLENYLFSHWEEFEFPFNPPRTFRYLLFKRAHKTPQKVVLYGIPEGQVEPLFLIKTSMDDQGNGSYLENEYNLLKKVRKISTDEHILGTIPKVLGLLEMGPNLALIETYMPGKPFHRRKRNPKVFQRSIEWLIRFHQSVALRGTLPQEMAEKYFTDPLDRFVHETQLSDEVRTFLAGSRNQILSWIGSKFPMVVSHNDFIFANILLSDHGIAVVDWEYAEYPSPPFGDFVHHCLRYLKFNKAMRNGAIVDFSRLSGKNEVIKEAIPRYLNALKLNESDVLSLAACYFIRMHFHYQSLNLLSDAKKMAEGLTAVARKKVVFFPTGL